MDYSSLVNLRHMRTIKEEIDYTSSFSRDPMKILVSDDQIQDQKIKDAKAEFDELLKNLIEINSKFYEGKYKPEDDTYVYLPFQNVQISLKRLQDRVPL